MSAQAQEMQAFVGDLAAIVGGAGKGISKDKNRHFTEEAYSEKGERIDSAIAIAAPKPRA